MPDLQRHFLLIAYHYPPLRSMGSMRMYYLSHELLKLGFRVSVITTSNVEVLDKDELPIDDEIAVYQAHTFDYRTIMSKFSKKTHYTPNSEHAW